jgi:hypothetical protein
MGNGWTGACVCVCMGKRSWGRAVGTEGQRGQMADGQKGRAPEDDAYVPGIHYSTILLCILYT